MPSTTPMASVATRTAADFTSAFIDLLQSTSRPHCQTSMPRPA
jgi:hypothetical protein